MTEKDLKRQVAILEAKLLTLEEYVLTQPYYLNKTLSDYDKEWQEKCQTIWGKYNDEKTK